MKLNITTLITTSLLLNSGVVNAGNNRRSVDVLEWQCRYCEFQRGATATLEGGLGYVSDDSYKFGEYTALHEQGVFVTGNVESHYRNIENANYWDIKASKLGLDTRALEIEGGQQGNYGLSFFYDEIPHYLSDTARTPFVGSGGNRLTLRPGWVFAGSTTGMTSLDNHLNDINLATKRTRVGAGAGYTPAPRWQTAVNYRHETREGKRQIAGSFYFNAAEFVQPVDYTTDSIDVTASYTSNSWQAKLAYHGSAFRNKDESLIWQNPYAPVVVGAIQGALALPPDNEYHQAMAAVTLPLGNASRVMADVAFGRMTQNEDFLSATTNATLALPPLPAASLNGRVDTLDGNIKWGTELTGKLQVNADYHYSDRDNKTERNTYEWVITDAGIATPRANRPYSYTRNTLKLDGAYRLDNGTRTSLGYDYQQYERSYQEVEESEEKAVWLSLVNRSLDNTNVALRLAHASRDKDGYQFISGVDSPENPLMRKYNMADRERNTLGVRVDFLTTAQSSMGIHADLADDDYPDSSIGLTASRKSALGFDFSTHLAMSTMVSFFLSLEDISSNIAGSQLYADPDWFGVIDDRFNTLGLSVDRSLLKNKLSVGLDYVYTHSIGKISVTEAGSASRLPDLITTLHSMKIHGDYRLNDKLLLRGTYWYEKYSSDDWAYDNVDENTVPSLLSLGQEAPSYNVNVILLSVRYEL